MEICGSAPSGDSYLTPSLAAMSTVAATALSGMNLATQRFSTAAVSIASGQSPDLAKDVVEVLSAKRDFEANLLVLRVDAEMSERLLDIVA